MKIKLFNNYYLMPFDLVMQYEEYTKVVIANASYLHAVEMDHIAFYENGELLSWFEEIEKVGLLNFLICDQTKIIGRISIYQTVYDDKKYASLSIFLDKKYHNLGIMSDGLEKFLNYCEELNIRNIMWQAKSINETSNYLALKFNFKFWKQIIIDPKTRNANWKCIYYNLYLKP